MAEETSLKEQQERSRQRRPHGGGRFAPVEKAKDFKGTLRRLIHALSKEAPLMILAVVLAMVSVIFSVIGPKILGQATNEVFLGVAAMGRGDGGIDFAKIAQILAFLLGIYLISSGAQAIQGWLMTGISQRTVFRFRKEIAEKISRVPLSYFDGEGNNLLVGWLAIDCLNLLFFAL